MKTHKGVSLVEVVFSIMIIAIISAGLITVTNYVHTCRDRTREYNELSEQGITIIEQIRADLRNGVNIEQQDYGYSEEKTVTGKSGTKYNVASQKVTVDITRDNAYDTDIYIVDIEMRSSGDVRLKTSTILAKEW